MECRPYYLCKVKPRLCGENKTSFGDRQNGTGSLPTHRIQIFRGYYITPTYKDKRFIIVITKEIGFLSSRIPGAISF